MLETRTESPVVQRCYRDEVGRQAEAKEKSGWLSRWQELGFSHSSGEPLRVF